MRCLFLSLAIAALTSGACRSKQPSAPVGASSDAVLGLLPAAAFNTITDDQERAGELFAEAAKVFTHPRCANCHPSDARPRQGDDSEVHRPPIWAGVDGRGAPAMGCTSCHQASNYTEVAMPGAPDWHLASPSMVFLGATPAQICAGLVDPEKNGGRNVAEVVEHVRRDALVAWGYSPGPGRTPAPGDLETLVGLMAAWADAGAGCPGEDR